MLALFIAYTWACFAVFAPKNPESRVRILKNQKLLMYEIHSVGFIVLFLEKPSAQILLLYAAQGAVLLLTMFFYRRLYPCVSQLVINNMCMLLVVGFVMLSRLSIALAVRQTAMAGGGIAISLLVPFLIRKLPGLGSKKMMYVYAVTGIGALGAVLLLGNRTYGAKLSADIHGIVMQPSEFVKILFVFFAAAALSRADTFKKQVIITAIAALHVLILVGSRDLGTGLIIYVIYLVMLYVATKKPVFLLAGISSGALASVVAYKLFNHVRVRYLAWKDPFAIYNNGGYQVAQSLFAIGTGGWFGLGLGRGMAHTIPVVESDFIFSGICEEMGILFGLCLVLVCLSCYMMFLNIALQIEEMFYKLVALGLGTCYIFQTFLTVGGAVKFIPSTGVTLPLVSYGGSSVFSTLIMFAIIEGLYIVQSDNEKEKEEAYYRMELKKARAEEKRRRQLKKSSAYDDDPEDYVNRQIGAEVEEVLNAKQKKKK